MPMTLTVKTLGHVNIRDGYSHTRHLTNQLESDAVKQAEGIKLGASPGKRWEDRPANGAAHREKTGTKNDGSGWTEKGSLVSHNRLVPNTGVQLAEGVKVGGSGAAWWREPLQAKRREATAIKNGGDWFGAGENCSEQRKHGSKSNSRKAASAMIAKIPFPLSNYIAKCFIPAETLRMVANG
jgi:hypothetical protein